MKASERRLLAVFVGLASLLGCGVGFQQLRGWQHRLERHEREVELGEMEALTLAAEEPLWDAKAAWLTHTLPIAQSELEANQGLLENLQSTAQAAGLKVTSTQIEPVKETEYYCQFGVSLGVKGELPAVMRWIHEKMDPNLFYVVPALRILPDKENPSLVSAQVRFWRWYAPRTANTIAQVPDRAPSTAP